MKKSASYFLNLFLSIVAFSFILNIGVVSAANTYVIIDGKKVLYDSTNPLHTTGGKTYTKAEADLALKGTTSTTTANLPQAATLPSHGYVEQGAKGIGLESSVAPKGGYVLDKSGNWVKGPAGTASTSGLGYSITGILQGALWGLIEKN